MTTTKYSGYSGARNYSPDLKGDPPPITWNPRDEQGFTIFSTTFGSWCAVPGKAVACTVISCTGWYHRPSNCTNYYLSLESGKRERSTGGALQDALEEGKATPHSRGQAAKLQVPHICLIMYRICVYHTSASSCTVFGELFNRPENNPTKDIYQSFIYNFINP